MTLILLVVVMVMVRVRVILLLGRYKSSTPYTQSVSGDMGWVLVLFLLSATTFYAPMHNAPILLWPTLCSEASCPGGVLVQNAAVVGPGQLRPELIHEEQLRVRHL